MLDNKLTISKNGRIGKHNMFNFSVMKNRYVCVDNKQIFDYNYSAMKVNNKMDTIQIDNNEEIQKKHRNYHK